MKIGVFDSGIGGLNVLKEIIKKYPNNTYYYYGDTKNIPYGEKDKETLLKLSTRIIKFFENKRVDIIIIACGTVSSNCFLELKKITKIPLYNIITPTITYLKTKKNKSMAVIATKRTIESHVFKEELKDIQEIKTSEFVPMIEENKIDEQIIEQYLKPIFQVDTLVLGCTHYPLLTSYLKKYVSKKTELLDMGVVLTKAISLTNQGERSLNLYFTKLNEVIKENINKIIEIPYQIQLIEDE